MLLIKKRSPRHTYLMSFIAVLSDDGRQKGQENIKKIKRKEVEFIISLKIWKPFPSQPTIYCDNIYSSMKEESPWPSLLNSIALGITRPQHPLRLTCPCMVSISPVQFSVCLFALSNS